MRAAVFIVSLLACFSQAQDLQKCEDSLNEFVTSNIWLITVGIVPDTNKLIADNVKCGQGGDEGLEFARQLTDIGENCGVAVGSYMRMLKRVLCMQDAQDNYCLGAPLLLLDFQELAKIVTNGENVLDYFNGYDWQKQLTSDAALEKICKSKQCAYKIVRQVGILANKIAADNDWTVTKDIKRIQNMALSLVESCVSDPKDGKCFLKKDTFFDADDKLIKDAACNKNNKLKRCAKKLMAYNESLSSGVVSGNNPCKGEVVEAGSFTLTLPNLRYEYFLQLKDELLTMIMKDLALLLNLLPDELSEAVFLASELVEVSAEDASPGTTIKILLKGTDVIASAMDILELLNTAAPYPGEMLFFFTSEMRVDKSLAYYDPASEALMATGMTATNFDLNLPKCAAFVCTTGTLKLHAELIEGADPDACCNNKELESASGSTILQASSGVMMMMIMMMM